MSYRGHSRARNAEMAASMIVPTLAAAALAALGVLSSAAALGVQHAVMIPAMLGVMLAIRRLLARGLRCSGAHCGQHVLAKRLRGWCRALAGPPDERDGQGVARAQRRYPSPRFLTGASPYPRDTCMTTGVPGSVGPTGARRGWQGELVADRGRPGGGRRPPPPPALIANEWASRSDAASRVPCPEPCPPSHRARPGPIGACVSVDVGGGSCASIPATRWTAGRAGRLISYKSDSSRHTNLAHPSKGEPRGQGGHVQLGVGGRLRRGRERPAGTAVRLVVQR